MVGSSLSIAGPNFILNTAVAEILRQFADRLEGEADFAAGLNTLIKETIQKHMRIIFNGNGYNGDWAAEAEKRGLLNLETTPDALPTFLAEKNIRLFETHRVFTAAEMRSRYEILMETYDKALHIEALTMLDMANRRILPASLAYLKELSELANFRGRMNGLGRLPDRVFELCEQLYARSQALEKAVRAAEQIADATTAGVYYKDQVIPAMNALRETADGLETVVGAQYWPFPTYGEILFGV